MSICNKSSFKVTNQIKTLSYDFYKTAILPYAGIIIKICRAYTNSQEDFEDYYQEVCLQIWKSRNNYKEKADWSTWIYRIALNVCLTLIKKKRVSTEYLEAQGDPISEASVSIPEQNEQITALYQAIRTLSEIDRAIILLYLEEKSYREIAQIIGTKTTNIGVRINRIKKQLKKILNGTVN